MREIVHIQAGQCGNQSGTKVSLGGAAAASPLGGRARPLLRAVPPRGAASRPPTPAWDQRGARSGCGAPRISPLPVTIKGFGKYRNQTGLFFFFFFLIIFMFKLARPWPKSGEGRQKSEQPSPNTETPQPVRARSWQRPLVRWV